MASIELRAVSRIYGTGSAAMHAVRDVDLSVADGEFMIFLGPSGCGKSTTLRMIAGLEPVSRGVLLIDGARVNDLDPAKRDLAIVFQNYALYPHMSVRQNMAFGLKLRGVDKAEIARRIDVVALILGVGSLLDRRPAHLSGGQRQRVALGRALVREPRAFLLDEPLSNLDAKLRSVMRIELVKLHQKLGTTMIHVTHDQVEAMTMGQRICIMRDGQVVQVGRPQEVYEEPVDTFVAGFLGTPPMNLIAGRMKLVDDRLMATATGLEIEVPEPLRTTFALYAGRAIILGLRPEDLHVVPRGRASAGIKVIVDTVEALGHESIVNVTPDGSTQIIAARLPAWEGWTPGSHLTLYADTTQMRLFDPETTQAIRRR